MKQEKQQAIALMRYGAIAPLIAGLDERLSKQDRFLHGTIHQRTCRTGWPRASLCTLNHRKMVSGLSEPRV